MEAAGSAATILQLVSFTGEVLVAGYGFLSKVQKAPAEIRSFLKETANLNALLDQLQSLVTIDAGPHVMSALETLTFLDVFGDCKALMKIVLKSIKACEQISGQGARNFTRMLLWPFKEKETKETLQQLVRLRETFSAAVAVDSAKTLLNLEAAAKMINVSMIKNLDATMQIESITRQTAEELTQLKIAFLDKTKLEEDAAVRGWLLLDGIDPETDFEAALRLRHPLTGHWFLDSDTFGDWLSSKNAFLWMYGIPGCGKTVLSATVVEHLRARTDETSSFLLYFFCNHRNPRQRTFQDCLHVFTKQLIDVNPDIFNEAKQYYHERLQKTQGQQGTLAMLSIDENVSLIKRFCSRFNIVFMVIDALDECSDRSGFLSGLQSFLSENGRIKILLTSRQEVDIERLLTPIASHRLALKEHMRSDIKLYLTAEIKKRIEQRTLKLRQQGLFSDIVAAVEEKADGMILIARLQLDYLCRLKSNRDIKEALNKLPTGISATYDEIIQQLCARNPESFSEMRAILKWLIGSTVPLALDQLAEAVSIRPEDERLDRDGIATDAMDLAAYCGSLVTVHTQGALPNYQDDLRGDGSTLISLSHSSVEEYLTSSTTEQGPSKFFFMDLPSVHRDLAETCLQYIGFEDFHEPIRPPLDSTNLENPVYFLQREMLKQRTNRYVLYDYACTYWATHLRLSKVSEDKRISELLTWFLVPERFPGIYKSWQQMYHHGIHYYCPGRPPLNYAFDFRLPFLIRVLLPQQDNIDILYNGMTALHEASRCGDIETCVTLLNQGASLELKSGLRAKGMTALHFAAEAGHLQIIKLLLGSGASPHARSRSHSTPFYRAARSGSLEALRLLYLAGSDINARTWDNWTALFEALARGLIHIASQLLEWGADPTIVTPMDISALTLISEARINAHTIGRSSEDITLGRGGQQQFHMDSEEDTEAITLQQIQMLQAKAQASANMTGDSFSEFLRDIEPGYWRLERIVNDTRPGIERDLSLVRYEDGLTISVPEEYFISYASSSIDFMPLKHPQSSTEFNGSSQ